MEARIPKVVDMTKIGCPLLDEDYETTRVIYHDGQTDVDYTAECDSCPYEAERQVWR